MTDMFLEAFPWPKTMSRDLVGQRSKEHTESRHDRASTPCHQLVRDTRLTARMWFVEGGVHYEKV